MRNTVFAKLYANDMTPAQRFSDALRGSQMLRDAILRAKGYPVPEPETIAALARPAPKFRERKVVKGRPRKRGRKGSGHSRKVETIKALVALHYRLSLDDLQRRDKSYERAHPRQVAMYLARKATTASYPRIAKQFGGFDHTTVLHAVRVVEARIAERDAETIEAIRAVHAVIGA